MRRNIALDYGEDKIIYLYTHWGAEELEVSLAHSLERGRDRWDDDSYLARIIFTDMTKEVGEELTGYGISPFEIDPEFQTLAVDLQKKTVNDIPYADFIRNPSMFKI